MALSSARLALSFSCIGHAAMHVMTAIYFTIVIALQGSWHLDYDTLIRLWTVGALLVGLGAPIAGWLGDRWSESGMMVVFFAITGAGGVAAGLADGTTALWIGLAVLGLGASIYHPVGLSWLVRTVPNPGRALGFLGVFGGVGIASAALIAGGLIAIAGWRAAFLAPGVICLGLAVALFYFRQTGRVADGDGLEVNPRKESRGDMYRAFIFLTITMAAGATIFHSLLTAMPEMFEQRMSALVGTSIFGVGALVTLVYLGGAAAQIVGGMLVDRYSIKAIYLVGLLIQVPMLAVMGQVFSAPLLVAAIAAASVASFIIPAENLMLARYTPAHRRGLAYGAKFILAFGIAPVAVQLVGWSSIQPSGFTLLLWILTGLGALALLAAIFLPNDRKSQSQTIDRQPAGNSPPTAVAPAE
ncbi:MAG: MFS transporter [Pseudomonadota bacterium]